MDTAEDNMEGLDQFMGVLCVSVNLLVIAMQLSEHTTKKSLKKSQKNWVPSASI
jgi:hypothetical protein